MQPVVYFSGVALAGFLGFSSMFTVGEIVSPLAHSPRAGVSNSSLAVSIQMQTDGWTRYETAVSEYYRARWTVVILGPDNARLCSGYGDAEYTPENAGVKHWGASYFTGDVCPEEIPFGSRGTATYIPYDAKHLPLIVDFVVREVPQKGQGQRAAITK